MRERQEGGFMERGEEIEGNRMDAETGIEREKVDGESKGHFPHKE